MTTKTTKTTTEKVAPEAPAVDVKAVLSNFVSAREAVAKANSTLVEATEAISTVVRAKREAMGLTRPPVARKAGITIAQLAGIELGRVATRDELVALGKALDIKELASL